MEDKMMNKLMGKKPVETEMSDMQKKAKMDVIMELIQMAQGVMGESVKTGLEPVKDETSVMVKAEDTEGLEEGLDMASELVADTDLLATEDEESEPSVLALEDEDTNDIKRLMGLRKSKI